MFKKKIDPNKIEEIKKSICDICGDASEVSVDELRPFMLRWLSAFAPDMSVYDAKSFCLPKLFFKNYLWNAFSFQKTECYMDEDAKEALAEGFSGPCFVLVYEECLLYSVSDGGAFTPENVAALGNVIITAEDYSKTYVNTGKDEFGPYYKSADMTLSDPDAEPIEPIEPVEASETDDGAEKFDEE